MTSSFNVQKAAGYEQLMGRWSRQLATPFIEFAGVTDGETVLDVGCGTGSLTFAMAENLRIKAIAAVDLSPVFVAAASERNTDRRISIQQADACSLPFTDGSFDRALALLVLHFVPEAPQAVREMRRVVRPGGTVAAAVWDHYGGMPGMRMVIDAAAAIDEAGRQLRSRYAFQPMVQPGELKQTFISVGLEDVIETEFTIRMNYLDFNDFWAPISAGEGPLGMYVAGLDAGKRTELESSVRGAFESGRPDGPRSFANVAWSCRGRVP